MGTGRNSFSGDRSVARAVVRVCLLLVFPAAAALAQNPQVVYTSSPGSKTLSGFRKDPTTGALTATPGSPYSERLDPHRLGVDPSGRFLFVVNTSTNDVSMFQIDGSTGALSEVPNSPFAAGGGDTPQAIVAAAQGTLVYVGNLHGSVNNGGGSINAYFVDATAPGLVPASVASTEMPSPVLELATDPKGRFLYAYLGMNSFTGDTGAYLPAFQVDSLTGSLNSIPGGGAGQTARSLAMDPKGRFLFAGHGRFNGFIDTYAISPLDGSLLTALLADLGPNSFPNALAVETGGRFLYANDGAVLRIFAIDQSTGALTETPGPPLSWAFALGAMAADPMGPFLYVLSGGIRAFQVDSASGDLTEVPGSPFGAGSEFALALTGTPVQPVLGPVTTLLPNSLNFGGWVVGATSTTLIAHLVNTGDQALAINSISITGANAGDFLQTNTCSPTLAVDQNCSISATFTPSALGPRQAALSVSDNAAGSPHSIPLSGEGIVARPAVALIPGALQFDALAAGNTSPPQSITLTNIGQATLHVTAVALEGANPGDFNQATDCVGAAIAVNGNCTITVRFQPAAVGVRSAILSISDDTPNTPHTATLGGTGDPPFTVETSGSGATTQTVTAGQTAQYPLQVAPEPGFTGSVSLACTGAPLGATCQLSPATLQVNGANPVPFSVTVQTTARSSGSLPIEWPHTRDPFGAPRWLPFIMVWAALLILLMKVREARSCSAQAQRLAWSRPVAAVVLLGLIAATGCGGAAGSTPPVQPAGTPPGTSMLTVAATSGSVTQTIQLTLTVK